MWSRFLWVLCAILLITPFALRSTGAEIEGIVNILPAKGGDASRVVPGTSIVVEVVVKNTGNAVSKPGSLFVRYAFPKPLNNRKNSVLFSTEKVELPAIEPGQEMHIVFKDPHALPTLFDFIRDDWGMRKYEAVAVINEKEAIIGNLPLTFSAYYYPGPSQPLKQLITP